MFEIDHYLKSRQRRAYLRGEVSLWNELFSKFNPFSEPKQNPSIARMRPFSFPPSSHTLCSATLVIKYCSWRLLQDGVAQNGSQWQEQIQACNCRLYLFKKPLKKTMPQRNSPLSAPSPLFLSSAAQFFSKKKGPLMVITAFAAAAAACSPPSPRYSARRCHSLFTLALRFYLNLLIILLVSTKFGPNYV